MNDYFCPSCGLSDLSHCPKCGEPVQMGGYIIEVTELRAKLEKAREALEYYTHCHPLIIPSEPAINALALLSSDNVIASIKAEALREAENVAYANNNSDEGGVIARLLCRMADELLQEKKSG